MSCNGELQTQQLLSMAGQPAVMSWRECSGLISTLSPSYNLPCPCIIPFPLSLTLRMKPFFFLRYEELGQRDREMKTSAGAGGEVAKGGQHLFWHVALRTSHVFAGFVCQHMPG